jgi:hypothetical protein
LFSRLRRSNISADKNICCWRSDMSIWATLSEFCKSGKNALQGELAHPTLLLAQVVDSGDSLCLSGLSVELSLGRMTALLLFWVYLSALALAVALLVPPVQRPWDRSQRRHRQWPNHCPHSGKAHCH